MRDSIIAGLLAEDRFFEACSERTEDTPDWFLKVRPASPSRDLLGIDFIASIERPSNGRPMRVPVQVKLSKKGVRKYFIDHPEWVNEKIVIIVVPGWMTSEQIRAQLYRELTIIRETGHNYDKFFRNLRWIQLSPRTQWLGAKWRMVNQRLREMAYAEG